MLDESPKTSIFGHLRVKADQLTQGEGYGRVIDLSEGQGLMPYTLNSAYNKKKYVEILPHYRQFFVKGNVIIQVGPA